MKFCCSDCFNPKRDTFHWFIRENGFASDEECPYCKSTKGTKIDVDILGRFIKTGIDRAYDDTGSEAEGHLSIFGILNDRVILFEWENHREHELTKDLFEKIEDAAIQAQLDRLERIKRENEEAAKAEALKNWRPEPVKAATNIDEFDKNDIRVATVLECTNVKKSDRLLQFKLDDGMGGRTILSGIAQSYPDPSVLVGKQVLFIANFPPRKMMGIESQGMILSAVDADGKLVVTTVSAPVHNGAQVG